MLARNAERSRVGRTDGDQDGPEGCLSVPGVWAERHRAAKATVEGVDLREAKIVVSGAGELARCLQHETDHLRGELYIDGLDPAERRRVLRQLHRDQLAGPPPDGPPVL